MKRVLFHLSLLLAAGAFGLAAGFVLHGKPGRMATAPGSVAPAPPTLGTAKRQGRAEVADDSPLTTRLQRDLATSSGVTRWLYWLEAIEKAKPADFLRLAKLAQADPTALRFLAARWAGVYPQHFFETLVAGSKSAGNRQFHQMLSELARVLFAEWPKRDPDAAIQALNGSEEDVGLRTYWRLQVADSVIQTDPERGLRLLADWHIERFGPRMNALAKWAAANPRHAAEFTLQNPAGYASELAMETIGKEWVRTDPTAALEFAVTKPGGLTTGLAKSALKEWASRDLAEAANWLAQAGTHTRNTLSPAFVESWAKQDAPNALAWCESNLSGSSLLQAVGAVSKGAADTDVAAAASLVASLDPSSARAEAAVAVARKWFPELSAGEPVKPEAIAWLSGLDAYCIKRVMDNIQWVWATTEPNTMAAFLVSSAAAHEVSDSAYTIVARELARKDPAEALQWANALSGERALTAGSEAFATWRSTQPEAASQWLNALPTTDARREPFFESTVRLLAWSDPQAAQQFAGMTAAERAIALNVVQKMSLPEERRASLLDVLKTR